VIELVRRVQNTQVFLRMAAIELRRIAERSPEIAIELRHAAQQLEAEAEDLVAAMPDRHAGR
jgi:type II secretory pathway component PulF